MAFKVTTESNDENEVTSQLVRNLQRLSQNTQSINDQVQSYWKNTPKRVHQLKTKPKANEATDTEENEILPPSIKF